MSQTADARAVRLRFRVAVDLLNSRRFLRARRQLLRLRAEHPSFPWSVQEILQTYHRRGELEAGEAWLRTLLIDQPEDPHLHYGLGYAVRRRGRPASEAAAHLRRALELDPGSAIAATELGFIEAAAGDHRGRPRVESALARFRQQRDRWGEATALNYLAHIARARHDFAAAHTLYERALSRKRQVGDRLGEAAALLSLGGLYFRSHDLGHAIACFTDAHALQRASGDRFGEWHAALSLGALHTKLRDYPEAERQLGVALSSVRRLDHLPGIALALDNLAIVLALTGRHARAARLLTDLLAERERLPVRQLTSTLRVLGWVELERGRLTAAERHLTAAHRLAVEHRLIEDQAHVAYELAALDLLSGRPTAALAWADESARLASRLTIGGNRPFVEGLRAGLRRAQAITALGDSRTAWREYAGLLDAFDNQVMAAGRDDVVMGLAEVVRETFDHAIALGLGDPAGCGLDDPAAVSLATAARARARALQQQLPSAGGRAKRRRVPRPVERAVELGEAALREVVAELAAADDSRARRRLVGRRRELQRDLAQLRRRVVPARGMAAASFDPDHLCRRLPAATAVLAYHFGERRIWAWVVTNTGVRAHPLRVGSRRVAAAIRAYLRPFAEDAATSDIGLLLEQYDVRAARRLYAWLVGPLARDLAAVDNLIIVADGPLSLLPFETLVIDDSRDATAASYWSRCRFLVERFGVSYAPSLTPLVARRSERSDSRRRLQPLLAIGDPALTDRNLAALPASRREVEDLCRIVPGTHPLVGAAATPGAYRAEAGRHRLIHLASHAVVDLLAPDYSGVVLAPDRDARDRRAGGDQPNGGLLHAYEIASIPLAADLVVLSGCQTGSGRLRRGEGLLSLARAFLIAGARATLVSLWNVHDASASGLMSAFYSGLIAGRGRAAALRDARLAAIAAGRAGADHLPAHPYVWGAFVLLDTELGPPLTDRRPGGRD